MYVPAYVVFTALVIILFSLVQTAQCFLAHRRLGSEEVLRKNEEEYAHKLEKRIARLKAQLLDSEEKISELLDKNLRLSELGEDSLRRLERGAEREYKLTSMIKGLVESGDD